MKKTKMDGRLRQNAPPAIASLSPSTTNLPRTASLLTLSQKPATSTSRLARKLWPAAIASTTIAPPDGHLRQNVPPLTPRASGAKNSSEIATREAIELGGAESLRPPIRRAQFQARLHSSA